MTFNEYIDYYLAQATRTQLNDYYKDCTICITNYNFDMKVFDISALSIHPFDGTKIINLDRENFKQNVDWLEEIKSDFEDNTNIMYTIPTDNNESIFLMRPKININRYNNLFFLKLTEELKIYNVDIKNVERLIFKGKFLNSKIINILDYYFEVQ